MLFSLVIDAQKNFNSIRDLLGRLHDLVLGNCTSMAKSESKEDLHDCLMKLRENPKRRRETVYVGCGAGFGGDRPLAALKLLQIVEEINYLVLECLAERTLADRWLCMASGGDGYDSRVSEWMRLLLPLAVEKGTCIITNMGAIDPCGAQKKVLEVASELGLAIFVAVAHEVQSETGTSRLLVKYFHHWAVVGLIDLERS